jgi:hypothetical protein
MLHAVANFFAKFSSMSAIPTLIWFLTIGFNDRIAVDQMGG